MDRIAPVDKRIRPDSYQLDLAFQSYVSVAEQDRGRTGFPTASIQVSPAAALQTGAGAGCRSRHASSRGRAVTVEARAAAAGGAAVAGAGDAAEAGGRCGGSRGGRSWRMRSLQRQVLQRWWLEQALLQHMQMLFSEKPKHKFLQSYSTIHA